GRSQPSRRRITVPPPHGGSLAPGCRRHAADLPPRRARSEAASASPARGRPAGGATDAGHATDGRGEMSFDDGHPLWRAVDDLLAGDAHAAQRALLAAGYVEVWDEPFVLRQHLRPLRSPTLGLKVELHTVPNWPPGRTPPPLQEILDRSVASGIGVDGIAA